MYKTIKIPEEAYHEAKELSKELEVKKEIRGLHNVNLSTAISYAITRTLENLKKRDNFLKSAGTWSDVKEIERIKKEIYKDRTLRKRNSIII